MNAPLADRMRPRELCEVVGQKHILGEGKVLYNIINSGNIPNMIFYGPSGTGKTTVANIAAKAEANILNLNITYRTPSYFEILLDIEVILHL